MSSVQIALDAVLEISEDKLSEGDYLEVSKHLKNIFDVVSKKAKARTKVISFNRILTQEMMENRPYHTYELSDDEKLMVMKSRKDKQLSFLKMEIKSVRSELKEIVQNKKNAFKGESRVLHRALVEEEKETRHWLALVSSQLKELDGFGN